MNFQRGRDGADQGGGGTDSLNKKEKNLQLPVKRATKREKTLYGKERGPPWRKEKPVKKPLER